MKERSWKLTRTPEQQDAGDVRRASVSYTGQTGVSASAADRLQVRSEQCIPRLAHALVLVRGTVGLQK